MKKKILIGMGGLFLLVVIIALAGGDSSPAPPVPAETSSPQTGGEAAQPPQPESQKTWQKVTEFSGQGRKTTEPFTITNEQWRINWENRGGYLGVSVYEPGGSLPKEFAVNTTETGADTSYIYKKGTFYLDINAVGGWVLSVEELR